MNKAAGGNELEMLGIGKLFSSRRRWENVGKNEESECDTEPSAKHTAQSEGRNAAPELVTLFCVDQLSGVIFRRKARRAATPSDIPIPPTHAGHPTWSKS